MVDARRYLYHTSSLSFSHSPSLILLRSLSSFSQPSSSSLFLSLLLSCSHAPSLTLKSSELRHVSRRICVKIVALELFTKKDLTQI